MNERKHLSTLVSLHMHARLMSRRRRGLEVDVRGARDENERLRREIEELERLAALS